MKCLVIKRDKLGDLLLATPMLAQIKSARPDIQLHVLANDYNAWVIGDDPNVDRLWVYRRVRHAGKVSLSAAWAWVTQSFALRAERYDWVIVANGEESPRAIRRGLAVKGARTISMCADAGKYRGLTDPVAPLRSMHEMDRMLALLVPMGIPVPREPSLPTYRLPAKSAEFAQQWLAGKGLKPGGYIVLGLGARRAKKQPSTSQVLAWSAHFRNAWGLDTVFMWTPGKSNDPVYPGDDETAQPVLDAKLPHLFPHRGPLWEALGLIWSAKTSLFPDSGLMHFAAASPGGVLGFFAETDVSPHPDQWAPRGARAQWLEAKKSVQELEDKLVLDRVAGLVGA